MNDIGIVMVNPETDVCIAPFNFEQYKNFLIWLGLSRELVKTIKESSIELLLVLDCFQGEQKESPRIYFNWEKKHMVFYGFEENEDLKPILVKARNFFRFRPEEWIYPKKRNNFYEFEVYRGIFNNFC